MNSIRVSNSLDPDQARRFVGPDLGPNCLQRLSADGTVRHNVKQLIKQTLKHILVGIFISYIVCFLLGDTI